MANVFDKLQLKDQKEIVILNAPESFEPELRQLKGIGIERALKSVKEIQFFLAFVKSQEEVDALAKEIASRATGDAVVWFAYPKGTSKRYTSTIKRDSGWDRLAKPVSKAFA